MSSFFTTLFTTLPQGDEVAKETSAARVDLWMLTLGLVALVLLVGGLITTMVGLDVVHGFGDTVLGQNAAFDGGVATAITGGAAIVLGVLVGTVWLVLGKLDGARA